MVQFAVARGIDQHAIDLARTEHVDDLDLFVEIVVRGRKQRAVTALGESKLNGLGGVGEYRIHDVGQHETDRARLAADE